MLVSLHCFCSLCMCLQVIDGEARQRQDRYFGLYAKLKASKSMDHKHITRDLHRTFPKHPRFSEHGGEGQQCLSNILNAYASFDHKVLCLSLGHSWLHARARGGIRFSYQQGLRWVIEGLDWGPSQGGVA